MQIGKTNTGLCAHAIRLAALCTAVILLVAVTATAQNPSGVLRGVVRDSSGARVVSAKISLRLLTTAQARTTVCDRRGEFRLDGLTPGTWELAISARGFAEADSEVQIAVSQVRDVLVIMKVAEAAAS